MTTGALLRLEGIVKYFGGVTALAGVDLALRSGVIHGLVGENGAGKSTLIRIICGIEKPAQGKMHLEGRVYRPLRPVDAKRNGIQVVHQELNLLTLMSVADNICFEHLPRGRFGIIRKREQEREARDALIRVGLDKISLSDPIENLGIAQRQLIEIARALKSQSRILILDEPTATLTAVESANLFRLLHELAAKGVAILLVSHHLDEIMEHCDVVTVMRNGRTVSTCAISETNINQLIGDMVERHDDSFFENGNKLAENTLKNIDCSYKECGLSGTVSSASSGWPEEEIILEVEGIRTKASPHQQGVGFSLRKGEILGIAGLVGAGRTELLRAIAGVDRALAGHVLVGGRKRLYTTPAQAIADGIAFVTEDRRHEGLVLPMSIAINMTLASTGDITRAGLLRPGRERAIAQNRANELELKYGDLQDAASTLSGGNQQKVVLAKWLGRAPLILLMDEPTRGVDVGAKAEIYALIRHLAHQGKGILLVSSEMRELMALGDRILVMAQHAIVGELVRRDFSQQRILQLAYQQAA